MTNELKIDPYRKSHAASLCYIVTMVLVVSIETLMFKNGLIEDTKSFPTPTTGVAMMLAVLFFLPGRGKPETVSFIWKPYLLFMSIVLLTDICLIYIGSYLFEGSQIVGDNSFLRPLVSFILLSMLGYWFRRSELKKKT